MQRKIIAIALRTCDSSFSFWDEGTRFVDASKSEITLTCLKSLKAAIDKCNHDVRLSVHDDTSSQETIDQIHNILGPGFEFINSGKRNNFVTQYDWLKKQECDYIYMVEDDYLHKENSLNEMIDFIQYMKSFVNDDHEYAVFPFNNPHRYVSVQSIYPSIIIKKDCEYWRSSFHSTHTFLAPRLIFDVYDNIMQKQAYEWAFNASVEDKTINNVWQEQYIRLMTPLNSLVYHLADSSQEVEGWKEIWDYYK